MFEDEVENEMDLKFVADCLPVVVVDRGPRRIGRGG
jgi:hypothetical protein